MGAGGDEGDKETGGAGGEEPMPNAPFECAAIRSER